MQINSNVVYSKSKDGDSVWDRVHDTFTVTVKHFTPGGGMQCWCLYAIIRPGHPSYETLSSDNTGADSYACSCPVVSEYMHCEVTFRDTLKDGTICIGSDYGHWRDDLYRSTPASNEACPVHVHALLLENALLVAQGSPPLLDLPLDAPRILAELQYDRYPTSLAKKLEDMLT